MLNHRQVATLAATTALAPIALDMYLPASVEMAASLGISTAATASTVSVFLFGISAGQLVTGPLSDRIGRRPVLLFGLILFSLASFVASIVSSIEIMLVARLLQALGACAALSSSRALVSDKLDPTRAAKLFSQMALIGGLAPVLAPLTGAWLVTHGGWRLNFTVMAVLGLAMLVASYFLLPESRSGDTAENARRETPFKAYKELLKNPAFRLYLAAGATNSAGFFAYIGNSPSIFQELYGLAPSTYSMLFALNSAALVTASQINRRLLSRYSALQVLRMSGRNAVLLAIGFLLFGLTGLGGLTSLVILLFFLVGSISPVQANTMAGGMGVDRLRAGSAAALFGATSFAVGAFASWASSLLYDKTTGPFCLLIAAFLLCAAMFIFRLQRVLASAPK